MRLIYLDESARDDRFYFFGALIVDAVAVREIENGINEVAALVARHVPGFDRSSEFHAVDMFHGEGVWDSVPVAWRVKACDLTAEVIARSSARFVFRGVDTQAQRDRYRNPFPPHLLTLAHTLQDVDKQLAVLDATERLGVHHASGDTNCRHHLLRAVARESAVASCRSRDLFHQPRQNCRDSR